jgi:hypothetical protein
MGSLARTMKLKDGDRAAVLGEPEGYLLPSARRSFRSMSRLADREGNHPFLVTFIGCIMARIG